MCYSTPVLAAEADRPSSPLSTPIRRCRRQAALRFAPPWSRSHRPRVVAAAANLATRRRPAPVRLVQQLSSRSTPPARLPGAPAVTVLERQVPRVEHPPTLGISSTVASHRAAWPSPTASPLPPGPHVRNQPAAPQAPRSPHRQGIGAVRRHRRRGTTGTTRPRPNPPTHRPQRSFGASSVRRAGAGAARSLPERACTVHCSSRRTRPAVENTFFQA